jgi:hypothetical protein
MGIGARHGLSLRRGVGRQESDLRPFWLVARAGATQTGAMAQLQLPVFAEGVTQLSSDLGVCCRDGRVSYFYGTLPVFAHEAKDLKSFRMFTSQLYVDGKVKQADLVRTFGVSAISVKRAVKLYEQAGPGGFWRPQPVRGPSVLTPEVIKQVQERLDQGQSLPEVAAALKIKPDTLRKAVRAGRLHLAVKKTKGPVRPFRA